MFNAQFLIPNPMGIEHWALNIEHLSTISRGIELSERIGHGGLTIARLSAACHFPGLGVHPNDFSFLHEKGNTDFESGFKLRYFGSAARRGVAT